MKRIFVLSVLVCMSLAMGGAAFAGHGSYTNGVEGIGAATAPPEGIYYRMYNVYYTANQLKDNNGKSPGDFRANVYAMANRFIYSSPIDFLGGKLVFDAVIPLVYSKLYYKLDGGDKVMDADRFNLGDILLEPLIVSWHGERWDAVAALGVFLPTGEFRDPRNSLRHAADPGKGFWSFMGSLGGTVYLDQEKTWSASILARYEIHTEQQYTHTTPGNDFHFEWGIGKTINKVFTLGVAGYCSWQTTRDYGKLAVNDYREQLYAIGPEIGFTIPDWNLLVSLRTLVEFENRNAPQGVSTILTLTKAF